MELIIKEQVLSEVKNANLSSNYKGVFNHARLIHSKLPFTDSIF